MITPKDLISLAGTLLEYRSESADRAAATHAYYAAYHACCVHFRTLVSEQKSGMHRQFIQGLQNSPDKSDKKLGYRLDEIYQVRLVADYKLAMDFPHEKAVSMADKAGKMVNELALLGK